MSFLENSENAQNLQLISTSYKKLRLIRRNVS